MWEILVVDLDETLPYDADEWPPIPSSSDMKELDDVRAYNSKLSHEINLLKKNSPQYYNNMKSPNQYNGYTQPNVHNFTNIQRSHPASPPNNIYQNHYSSAQAFFRWTPLNYQLYNNY